MFQNNDNRFFQAIGIIQGVVSFSDDETEARITFPSGQTYKLFKITKYFKVWEALKSRVRKGVNTHRLLVYPRPIHFPDKRDRLIHFRLVGFQKETDGLMDVFMEPDLCFKIAGIWQTITGCPCISIYRNFSEELSLTFKSLEFSQKVRLTKAQHVPVHWPTSIVPPYRFNPRSQDTKKERFFIQIKAIFIPGTNFFDFDSLLSTPTKDIPRYLSFRTKKKPKNKKIIGKQENMNMQTQKAKSDKPKKTALKTS